MGEVEISIKARQVIAPAEKTWTGTMKLSEIDMSMAKGFVPKLYVYGPHSDWDGTSMGRTLKESLAKAVVHFYPFVGRLRPTEGGRSELVVDDSDASTWGVPLVQAEAHMELAALGDLMEAELNGRLKRLFSMPDYGKPLQEMPLLTVQVTYFKCGGVAVAVTWSHAVVDGFGAGHFYSIWTRLARGELLGVAPHHDRAVLRPGQPPRSVPEFIQLDDDPTGVNVGPQPILPTTIVKLGVSKSQVNKLKQMVGKAVNGRPYSRFEVLSAHIWRCVSKAKGHKDDEKRSALAIAINIRKRIDPPLPQAFTGNAVMNVIATGKSEDLASSPLGHTCGIIRETVNKVTSDLVWSHLDYLKSLDDLGAWRGIMTPEGRFMNPDAMIVSWMNLSFNNLDFGWGKEAYMASGPHTFDGVACLVDSCEEGSAVVAMCLQVDHVNKFKECFLKVLK